MEANAIRQTANGPLTRRKGTGGPNEYSLTMPPPDAVQPSQYDFGYGS